MVVVVVEEMCLSGVGGGGGVVQEICLSISRKYICLFRDVFVQGICLSVQGICLFRGCLFRRYV